MEKAAAIKHWGTFGEFFTSVPVFPPQVHSTLNSIDEEPVDT
jgi:hypothetical protein